MTEKKRHRIKFFSIDDMACGHQLSKAEGLLNSFNANSDFSMIDLIEFYNIKLYFDNKLFLTTWDENQKESYKMHVEMAYKQLKERILKISDENLEQELTELDYNYYENYWSLLNDLNSFKKIADSTLSTVLEKNPIQIRYILKEKK